MSEWMDSKYHFLTSMNKSGICRVTNIRVLMRKGPQTGEYLFSFVRRQYLIDIKNIYIFQEYCWKNNFISYCGVQIPTDVAEVCLDPKRATKIFELYPKLLCSKMIITNHGFIPFLPIICYTKYMINLSLEKWSALYSAP